MRNNKAPGPSGITAEMIKALDEVGVDWLHTILNEFLTDERIPGDLKESEIVTIYKQQESPADAVKPARRKSMPKLHQFDVFRFISPNFISPNCQCIASRLGSRPI